MTKVYLFKALVVLFYVFVLVFNYLANTLPLNNRTTGAISDAYPSYFTPAGFTFSIWGIIYLLIGVFVFQLVTSNPNQYFSNHSVLFHMLFWTTCVLNISWLFAWHYDKIGLSLLIMSVFLITLLFIVFYVKDLPYFTNITFSVYAGWIAIAFIANVTIYLVKLDLPIFQNHEISWYILVMIIGVIIGLLTMLMTKNLVFVAVFIWAYFGIYMKHFQQMGTYLPRTYNLFNLSLLMILMIGWLVIWITNHYRVLN